MAGNIADGIYTTLYEIIVEELLPTLSTVTQNLNSLLYFDLVATVAVLVLGLIMMFGKIDMLNAIKSLLTIFIVISFFSNPSNTLFLLDILRSVFIDGAIDMGTIIVNTIASKLGIGTIQLEPSDGSTAFGKLWEISTSLASSVWETGGMTDIGALFMGAVLYIVAIFLLVAQILMLGTVLIMTAIAIYITPVFLPMILFKATRPMFQSWIGFGLGGAFGILILMSMIGIIFGFIAVSFQDVFDINIQNDGFSDIDEINDIEKLSALMLFMIISIKLFPNVGLWASSLAGASAAGITDGLTSVGTSFAKSSGLLAKQTAKQTNNKLLKPAGRKLKRDIGRITNGLKTRLSSGTNSNNTTTNQGAQNQLKSAIKQRLHDRAGQGKRPLATHARREGRLNNIKSLGYMPNETNNSVVKENQKQKIGIKNTSNASKQRPLKKPVYQEKQSHLQKPNINDKQSTDTRPLVNDINSQNKKPNNTNLQQTNTKPTQQDKNKKFDSSDSQKQSQSLNPQSPTTNRDKVMDSEKRKTDSNEPNKDKQAPQNMRAEQQSNKTINRDKSIEKKQVTLQSKASVDKKYSDKEIEDNKKNSANVKTVKRRDFSKIKSEQDNKGKDK